MKSRNKIYRFTRRRTRGESLKGGKRSVRQKMEVTGDQAKREEVQNLGIETEEEPERGPVQTLAGVG